MRTYDQEISKRINEILSGKDKACYCKLGKAAELGYCVCSKSCKECR